MNAGSRDFTPSRPFGSEWGTALAVIREDAHNLRRRDNRRLLSNPFLSERDGAPGSACWWASGVPHAEPNCFVLWCCGKAPRRGVRSPEGITRWRGGVTRWRVPRAGGMRSPEMGACGASGRWPTFGIYPLRPWADNWNPSACHFRPRSAELHRTTPESHHTRSPPHPNPSRSSTRTEPRDLPYPTGARRIEIAVVTPILRQEPDLLSKYRIQAVTRTRNTSQSYCTAYPNPGSMLTQPLLRTFSRTRFRPESEAAS